MRADTFLLQLLLLLWKTLLACFGGMKDIKRVKKLVRNIESLPEDVEQSEGVYDHYRQAYKR